MALWLVPVPIGNLKDITLRSLDVLKEVDFIIAEDTRYSIKLLNHYNISKPLKSCYKDKEKQVAFSLIKKAENEDCALITDCGTPGISDPGYFLVQEAVKQGVKIFSLPGPTAFVPALVSSGIEPFRFTFAGFPPRKTGDLRRFLKSFAVREETLIFYESPRRVFSFFTVLAEEYKDRDFALAKELSKRNEALIRGKVRDFERVFADRIISGEIVIIVSGFKGEKKSTAPDLKSREDIFRYFKENHNISRNNIKKAIMNKQDSSD